MFLEADIWTDDEAEAKAVKPGAPHPGIPSLIFTG